MQDVMKKKKTSINNYNSMLRRIIRDNKHSIQTTHKRI